MMKQMRENTKIVLWVVVVAFLITIFAVWGLDLQSTSSHQEKTLVGRVNGVTVTPQMYNTIYTQMAQQVRSQSGDLTSAQQEMIRDQAWENIVSNIITSEQIKKLGITVTDEEVLNFLKNSPPSEVQQYFKDKNGNFDYAAYQAALNNPDADWTAVEELARQRIPIVKLNQYLMSQVHVSAAEVRRLFAEQNTKLVARYVEFPLAAEDLGGWSPSPEEVKAYYDAHADQFKDVERATVEFVRVPVTPSQEDKDELIKFAQSIREDAVKSGDFQTQVTTFSEAQTAKVGGETGLLGRTQRDAAVMNAADALKPGEISQPVVTADGIYVIQLIEKKKEKGEDKYNLRELFVKLNPSAATQDTLAAQARAVQESASASNDLAAAAKAHGLALETSQPFAEGFPVPGLGYYPAVSRFAFASKPGAISGVISDDKTYIVCRLKEKTPAAARPLDQVSETIKQTLIHDRRVSLAMRKADGLARSASMEGTTFDAAAAQYGYKIAKTDSFTVAQTPPGMTPNAPFARAALAIETGAVSKPVESGNSVYVLQLVGRRDPTQADFTKRAGEMRDAVYTRKVQEYVAYWYSNVKDASKIEDLRGNMF
jgi:parvulin-like peptidyl-prolyl isomerase